MGGGLRVSGFIRLYLVLGLGMWGEAIVLYDSIRVSVVFCVCRVRSYRCVSWFCCIFGILLFLV